MRIELITTGSELLLGQVLNSHPGYVSGRLAMLGWELARQKAPVTTIVREYPEDFGSGKEAYYPIPAEDTKIQYAKYAERAEKEKGVTFVGRLATYRYYNMDRVVS